MFLRVLFLLLLCPTFLLPYTVVRKDGKVFSGELMQQSPQAILLKGKDGVTLRFEAHQIDWDMTTEALRKEESSKEKAATVRQMGFETREIAKRRKWVGEPMTFDFKDLDIRDFFRFIADLSGMNLIIDPAVKGTITMKMHEVPWDQVLDLVCRQYGLGYEIDGHIMSVQK